MRDTGARTPYLRRLEQARKDFARPLPTEDARAPVRNPLKLHACGEEDMWNGSSSGRDPDITRERTHSRREVLSSKSCSCRPRIRSGSPHALAEASRAEALHTVPCGSSGGIVECRFRSTHVLINIRLSGIFRTTMTSIAAVNIVSRRRYPRPCDP